MILAGRNASPRIAWPWLTVVAPDGTIHRGPETKAHWASDLCEWSWSRAWRAPTSRARARSMPWRRRTRWSALHACPQCLEEQRLERGVR